MHFCMFSQGTTPNGKIAKSSVVKCSRVIEVHIRKIIKISNKHLVNPMYWETSDIAKSHNFTNLFRFVLIPNKRLIDIRTTLYGRCYDIKTLKRSRNDVITTLFWCGVLAGVLLPNKRLINPFYLLNSRYNMSAFFHFQKTITSWQFQPK